MDLSTKFYVVSSIDGDYAHLRRIDPETEDEKLVARALLPPEIMEGSKLKYEMLQYEVVG
ncbi:MAG: chorismate--pyruvate lyase [Blautia sp.]|nr:chorismate--pyruvate lyase [Blautia sp.]